MPRLFEDGEDTRLIFAPAERLVCFQRVEGELCRLVEVVCIDVDEIGAVGAREHAAAEVERSRMTSLPQ